MSESELSDADTSFREIDSHFATLYNDVSNVDEDYDSLGPIRSEDYMSSSDEDILSAVKRRSHSAASLLHEDSDTTTEVSALESLPFELIQDIATFTNSDFDLEKLSRSSPHLAKCINAARSDVWRRRFTTKYDYPKLNDHSQFAIAYRLRRFVLRQLDGTALRDGKIEQAQHQLLVLQDMILETYNRQAPHLPFPRTSKNLTAFSSPDTSPWIAAILDVALFANHKAKYGKANILFDTIQVVLSHLVLNPQSAVSLRLSTSRGDYDLARVYNFNRPFQPIMEQIQEDVRPKLACKSKIFPNLKSSTPEPSAPRYRLCMHTILHIRNFWRRHFAEEVNGIGENTYSSMARNMVANGMFPRGWTRPLAESTPLLLNWVGHYSCLHPWPKNRGDLEERQSCAEDWGHIDPMTLQLETCASNEKDTFWPRAFSTIPFFEQAMPAIAHRKPLNVTYIRGIAPFVQLKHGPRNAQGINTNEQEQGKRPAFHPFLASRVHGFVHDIPDEAMLGRKPRKARFSQSSSSCEKEDVISGWKHIVCVIYKPTTRQLVSVLEFAEEDFGGASGTEMQFNTANVWSDGPDQSANAQQSQEEGTASSEENVNASADSTAGNQDADGTTNQPSEQDIEGELKKLLSRRLKTFTESYSQRLAAQAKAHPVPFSPATDQFKKTKSKGPLPDLFSPKHIRMLEEDFSAARYLTWDDGTIDYAYAYEGVILPGGKIMLGRWWRINGSDGLGPGKEVNPEGAGVEMRPPLTALSEARGDDADTISSPNNHKQSNKRPRKASLRCKKRRSTRKANLSRAHVVDSNTDDGDDEHATDTDREEEDGVVDEEASMSDKEPQYEFVTMFNGEESRAQNATKGLERGPFVFWSY